MLENFQENISIRTHFSKYKRYTPVLDFPILFKIVYFQSTSVWLAL